jgi:hypothetical protein
MCDYSLHSYNNRLAVEGEQLTAYRFHSGTVGLVNPADLAAAKARTPAPPGASLWGRVKHWLNELGRINDVYQTSMRVCAVCVPPDAVLELVDVRVKTSIGDFYIEAPKEGRATFTMAILEPFRHRDGLRIGDRDPILLQSVEVGSLFKVVSLAPVEAEAPAPVARPYYACEVGAAEYAGRKLRH